jgi:hypothetical protein
MDDMSDDIDDCNLLRVTINDQPAVRAEEVVAVGSSRSLVVDAPENGGIHVVGSQSAAYEAASESLLRDIRVSVNANKISADGPDVGRWVVYFLVRVPRNATLDSNRTTGPLLCRTSMRQSPRTRSTARSRSTAARERQS